MFHILITVCPYFSISFSLSSKFAEAFENTCLRSKAPLLLRFVCVEFHILTFKLLKLTMFTYAMQLYGWILICLFITFISYSPAAISFNSCESDEKLSLAKRMDGDLAIFSKDITLVFTPSSSSSSPSKELIIDTGLLGWWLLDIFGCFRGVDITGLFRVLFLPLTSFHKAPVYLLCIVCNLFYGVSVPCIVHKISFSSRFVQTNLFLCTPNFVAGFVLS